MSISFGSINSGLPKDIVQQILAAEKIPLRNLENRKAKLNNRQSLVDDLKGRLENLRGQVFENRSARSLRELQVNISDSSISASVDKNLAEPGTYQVEVKQLAQKSSVITNGVEDKDETYLGVGYISYVTPGGEEGEVFIDAENSSLTGIAKLINSDPGNGMRANVVNDGTGSDEPFKLIISLDQTGDDNRAEFPYLYFLDGDVDFYLDEEREAKDAIISMDGFEIQIPSNVNDELIPGVTLNFKKAQPGEEVAIEIIEDKEAITGKVDELVKAINSVFKFINEQNALDENSDTSSTLGGDVILQTIESRLRQAVFGPVNTTQGSRRLADLGITFQRTGELLLDQQKLENMVSSDFAAVGEILNGRFTEEERVEGVIDRLSKVTEQLLKRPFGILPNRKAGIRSKIDQIDRQIETKERLISQKEEILKQKFARLEETISRIRTQGAGLAALGGGGGNPVVQLG